MDHFHRRGGELHCDGVPAAELAARFGTPLYVYCARTIRHHVASLREAFAPADSPPVICYSVKANSNLAVLRLLSELGCGFDVVSGGELERVREIGGAMERTVYAGVGKTAAEIDEALAARLLLINVESASELDRIALAAGRRGVRAEVAIRVNPDVDSRTHRYITTGKRENKFGVDLECAAELLAEAERSPHLTCRGLHVHVGSQITEVAPYVEAVERVVRFLEEQGARAEGVRWLDLGGGFGVHYRGEEALPARSFAEAVLPLLSRQGLRLILEPGRFIVANAGILLTRVVTVKRNPERRFLVCDAGMGDLLRPALYEAFHRIEPVAAATGTSLADVVGPICESGDFLGLDRELPEVAEGELLAVFSAGAYGFSMASNYNSRGRPAEILVDGTEAALVRRRENYEDLVRAERGLP